MQNTAPPTKSSYYITSLSSSDSFNLGSGIGSTDSTLTSPQDTDVILDFGRPATNNGGLGTEIFDANGSFASMDDIVNVVENVGAGYIGAISANPNSHLTIIMGISNYDTTQNWVTPDHGAAWAQAVTQADTYMVSQNWGGRVAMAGGSDVELGYNTPSVTVAWVDAYASNYSLGSRKHSACK